MLVSPGTPNSSHTELYPFCFINTLCYLMKSLFATRMSFLWKIQSTVLRNSPSASALLKHVHSRIGLTPYRSECSLRCRKHLPVLNLKTGKKWTIRKLLQSYGFTTPGYYSEVFPHKKLFCHYTVGRRDPLYHFMLNSL